MGWGREPSRGTLSTHYSADWTNHKQRSNVIRFDSLEGRTGKSSLSVSQGLEVLLVIVKSKAPSMVSNIVDYGNNEQMNEFASKLLKERL